MLKVEALTPVISFTLPVALFPLLLAPLGEAIGRKYVYMVSYAVFFSEQSQAGECAPCKLTTRLGHSLLSPGSTSPQHGDCSDLPFHLRCSRLRWIHNGQQRPNTLHLPTDTISPARWGEPFRTFGRRRSESAWLFRERTCSFPPKTRTANRAVLALCPFRHPYRPDCVQLDRDTGIMAVDPLVYGQWITGWQAAWRFRSLLFPPCHYS